MNKNNKTSSKLKLNYCSECGTKLPKDAEFCPKCGAKVIKQIDNSKSSNNYKNNSPALANNETNVKDKNIGPTGIGGWLTIFLISLLGTIAILTIDVLQNFSSISNENAFIVVPIFLIEVVIIILALITLFKLSSLKKIVVKYAKSYAILGIVLGFALIMVSLLFRPVGDNSTTSAESQLMSAGLRDAIYGGIWLLYFYRSKRVKNTFVK